MACPSDNFTASSMNHLKKLRRIPELLAICMGYALVPLLPRRAVVAAARCLGALAFRVCGRQRRVALANLELAFGPDMPPDRKTGVVQAMYRIFALIVLDIFWFGVFTRRRIARWVHTDDSLDVYLKTKPAVVVTAHFGNWEVMGQAVALLGAPCVSVAAPLDNALVDRLMVRRRTSAGQGVVDQQGAVPALLNALRKGANVALLVDQNVLPQEGGEYVDFFKLPVPMSRAPAVLAQRTGAQVVFLYCIADNDGRYTLFGAVPRTDHNSDKGPSELTRAIADTMQRVIADHPEQWLWIYKRWKYVPEDRRVDQYPFYARRSRGSRLPAADGT